jgi:CRP-like cAMP-binding protein
LRSGKDDIFGDSIQDIYLDSDKAAFLQHQTHANNFSHHHSIAGSGTGGCGKAVYSVRALTYCDLHKIAVDDLTAILDVYPEFAGDFLRQFAVTFNLRQVSISYN